MQSSHTQLILFSPDRLLGTTDASASYAELGTAGRLCGGANAAPGSR